MKSALRLIMIAAGLALIGTAIGAVLFRAQLERLARQRMETRFGYLFDSAVSIEAIQLVPLERGVELLGVEVENPPEFKEGEAIRCRRILLQPDLRTLFSPTITFDRILVDGLAFGLRFELGKGTNLGALTQHAAQWAQTQPPARMLAVREFTCQNAAMKLSSNLTLIPFSMEIEPFKLKELHPDRPINTGKLTAVFLRSLLMETLTLKGLLRPVADLLKKESNAFAWE